MMIVEKDMLETNVTLFLKDCRFQAIFHVNPLDER